MSKVRAIGRSIKKRRLSLIFLVGIFAVGLVAGTYAVSTTDVANGQFAAGDHDWWQDQGTGAFCERCHQAIMTDIAAGPHKDAARSDCSFCHSPGVNDHAASPAQCTDCHGSEGAELAGDAHAGILTDTGETAGSASQACQSCHTHVSVEITAPASGPIGLTMTP